MKLDRNLNPNRRGKYALLKLRELTKIEQEFGTADGTAGHAVREAIKTLQGFGILDWGDTVDSEFWVMRLKDRCAQHSLQAYADAARSILGDAEYAGEVDDMARRAGPNHPNCKNPD